MTSHEVYSKLSWERFVESCAEAYKGGVSERDFGAALVGQRVCWEGAVERVELKEKYSAGLRIRMSCVELPLDSGRAFVGDSLFLLSGPRMSSAVKEQEKVRFTGRFRQQNVFSNIMFTVDNGVSKVFVSLSLEDGELLDTQ